MKTPYRFWSKYEINEMLIAKAMRCGMGTPIRTLITEAIHSEKWDPNKDYTGQGALSDTAISQFVFAYLSKTGQAGKDTDDILYHLMKMEGVTSTQRQFRYVLNRLKWLFYIRWGYDSKDYTEAMVDAIAYINR